MISVRDRVGIPLDEVKCNVEFVTFDGMGTEPEHFAIVFGKIPTQGNTLVRIHSECITGDVFGSRRCDCGDQLRYTIEMLSRSGGVILYLRQEGRGIGLYEKLSAYRIQDGGVDTFAANEILGHDADGRSYDFVPGMLIALNISSISLITNNPDKVKFLQGSKIGVAEVINTPSFLKDENLKYIAAKRTHGHNLAT